MAWAVMLNSTVSIPDNNPGLSVCVTSFCILENPSTNDLKQRDMSKLDKDARQCQYGEDGSPNLILASHRLWASEKASFLTWGWGVMDQPRSLDTGALTSNVSMRD